MDVWRTLRYLPTTTKSLANYRLRRKKVKVFGFSLNYREFFNEIFLRLFMFISTQNYKFYSIVSNYDKVMPC